MIRLLNNIRAHTLKLMGKYNGIGVVYCEEKVDQIEFWIDGNCFLAHKSYVDINPYLPGLYTGELLPHSFFESYKARINEIYLEACKLAVEDAFSIIDIEKAIGPMSNQLFDDVSSAIAHENYRHQ